MSFNSCCFSGHRNISIKNTEIASAVIDKIILLYNDGCRDFYVGGALGFDMLATIMLVSLKNKGFDLKIHFVLPSRDYNKRWSKSDRQMQEYLQTFAYETVYMGEKYFSGCNHMRNRYMVDNSDCLIAYLKEYKGGTYYTYKYAKENEKEIILI